MNAPHSIHAAAFPAAPPAEKRQASLPVSVWLTVWLLAIAARLWAAYYLPNAGQDGYSDAHMIARLSEAIGNGQLPLADLYGFWLPLFQLVAALPNLWVGDALL